MLDDIIHQSSHDERFGSHSEIAQRRSRMIDAHDRDAPLTLETRTDSIMLSPTKGDEMRASDQIKETRSYVFRRKATGEIEVRGSHWAAGYTSDYCATPDEAIDQAIKKAEREMARLQTEIEELYDYKATMMSEDR